MNAILHESQIFAPLGIDEVESLARHAYSLIGAEYYDVSHITCRNFEQTVDSYLATHTISLQSHSRYLEVGCGRSRLSRYSRPDAHVFLLDLSEMMLAHALQKGIRYSSALLGSAFALPFRDASFEAVFAFLADPYVDPVYFTELSRTVRTGGYILQIVPSYEWGSPLREHRQAPAHFSHFFRGTREAFGPSFLVPKSKLAKLAAEAGFIDFHLTDLYLPPTVAPDRISPDIKVPADIQGCSPYELPLLTVIEALRS